MKLKANEPQALTRALDDVARIRGDAIGQIQHQNEVTEEVRFVRTQITEQEAAAKLIGSKPRNGDDPISAQRQRVLDQISVSLAELRALEPLVQSAEEQLPKNFIHADQRFPIDTLHDFLATVSGRAPPTASKLFLSFAALGREAFETMSLVDHAHAYLVGSARLFGSMGPARPELLALDIEPQTKAKLLDADRVALAEVAPIVLRGDKVVAQLERLLRGGRLGEVMPALVAAHPELKEQTFRDLVSKMIADVEAQAVADPRFRQPEGKLEYGALLGDLQTLRDGASHDNLARSEAAIAVFTRKDGGWGALREVLGPLSVLPRLREALADLRKTVDQVQIR